MKTRGPMYSDEKPTLCPSCGGEFKSLMLGYTRFLKCQNLECLAVFWWDGPSLLEPKDSCKKYNHSGFIEELTDAQIDKVCRL